MIIYKDVIPSSFKAVDICVRSVIREMESYDALQDDALLFKVSFVLRELMNNSVEHGHNFDIEKNIHCTVGYEDPFLKIEISDQGPGIKKDQTYLQDIDNDKRERRRGLKLIEELDFNIELVDSIIRLDLDVS